MFVALRIYIVIKQRTTNSGVKTLNLLHNFINEVDCVDGRVVISNLRSARLRNDLV